MLRSDGSVQAWGHNAYGQLGDGTTTQRLTAVRVQGLPSLAALAADDRDSPAARSDESTWTWGNGAQGQLGVDPNLGFPVEPRLP